eukprot:9531-Heterococcus_DN1.PRE.1
MRSEDEAAELTRPDSKKNVKQNSVSSWIGSFGSGGWSSPTKTSARAPDADYSPMGHRRTQSLSPASPAAGGSMTPQAYKRELERKRRARLRMAQAAAADSTPHEEQESAGNDNSNSNSDADAAADDDDDGESQAQSEQQQQEAPRSSSPLLSPPGNGKSGGVPGALFEGDSPASFVRKQSNPARTAAAAATTAAAAPMSVQPQSKSPVSSPSRQVQFAAVKSTASTSGASLQPHHHGHTVSAPCGPAAAVAA